MSRHGVGRWRWTFGVGRTLGVANGVFGFKFHRCQPSRIRRDSPAFSSDVPQSREISRCPAFFENGIIIFSVAD